MPALDLPGDASTLLLWRKDLRSQFRLLDNLEASALTLMRGGATFEQLCAAMVQRLGEEAGVVAAGTMLGRWMTDALIRNAGPTIGDTGR